MVNRREILKRGGIGLLYSIVPAFSTQSRPADVTPKKLILIHGRAQQGIDSNELKERWVAALNRGLNPSSWTIPTDVEVIFPFYADILDRFSTAFEVPLTVDIQTKGAPMHDEFLSFEADFAEALRRGV